MTLETIRILRIELTVTDLSRSERFYVDGLGFTVVARPEVETSMTTLLGGERILSVALQRGGQTLMLHMFQPPGERYPDQATSCDQAFQHFAMPVSDMRSSLTRLTASSPIAISQAPQRLPASSGGAVACKFRDPDGHPLELIQFPDGHDDGIDHSAIVVTDVERSIAFYRDHLGLGTAARQVNTGAEQDALDALPNVTVEVVALTPDHPTPHLELLAYRTPPVRPAELLHPRDVAATRLVLEVKHLPDDATRLQDGGRAMLLHDPDRHALLLISNP